MQKLMFLLLFPLAGMAQKNSFKINGELKSMKPIEMVYLMYYDGEKRQVDSVPPSNGNFVLGGEIEEPTLATFMVRYAELDEKGRHKREMDQIFLEPSVINISASGSLDVISVSGSESHVEYLKLVEGRKPFTEKINLLYEQYSQIAQSGDEAAMEKLAGAIRETQKKIEEDVYKIYVQEHPGSVIALYALQQYAGYDIDAAKVEPLFNNLSANIRSLPSAVKLQQQIALAKKTAVGQPAMDFTQNDPNGNPVALSSFRGKYVLVDFWASWCGPCRRENPNLVKAFNAFKEKNFTVLGVSLDRPDGKEKWLQAIEKDNLTWTQVSDLQYFDNAAAKLYGIQAIPQNLLIDPNGIIIARNLRGSKLLEELERLVK